MPVLPLPAAPSLRSSPPPAVVLGVAGAAVAAATVPVVVLMHLVEPWSRVNPVRRTISEYAVGPGGWLFDTVVVALALASAAVLAALVGAGVMRARSAPAALIATWVVGMLLVVAFEKTNWAIGPSPSGYVHRYASLIAFLALPAAALRLARGARDRWPAGLVRALSALALLAAATFVPIVVAIVLQGPTGVPWFRAVPLGLIERVLAAAEVGIVVALGLGAARAAGNARAARAVRAP